MKNNVKIQDDTQSLQSCVSVSVTELRIGNYINDEETTHIVVGLDSFMIQSYWLKDKEREYLYGTHPKNIKPIPLTEEWLLKFGFTQCENEYWYEKGFFGISHEGCVNLQGRGNNEFVVEAVIKYVHQLQNLYYALTSSELQIGNLTEH